jgi:outer membrane protein OmpA-like peptidoglycan-associated protein
MIRQFPFGFAVMITLQGAPVFAAEFQLSLPNQAELTLELRAPMTTRNLALGPFQDEGFAEKAVTAPLHDSAYRVAADADMSTAALLDPLRAQLIAAGFTSLFECETRACGGFDFRYGLDLLPEPEMHVDLGDFRYVLAQKGDDLVSLMVSRSPNYGFVQVTRMGDWAKPAPKVTESSKSPILTTPISAGLSSGAVAIMDGIVFASGQATLENARVPALQDLADWMAANPTQKVTITGHTDSSGQAAANLALSLARAAALRDVLVTQYQIASERIAAIGTGDTIPLGANDTAEGRAKNRRVEVSVTP